MISVSFEEVYTAGYKDQLPHNRMTKAIVLRVPEGEVAPIQDWLEEAGFAVSHQRMTSKLVVWPKWE